MKKLLVFITLFAIPFFTFGQTTFDWAKQMGGTGDDEGFCIVVDSLKNSYITGYFTGMADFDPSASTANITSFGDKDIFIAKYDSLGNFIWVKQMGGVDEDEPSEIQIDKDGNIYCVGQFKQMADFDPSTNTSNLTALGEQDVFICKLDNAGNLIWVKQLGGSERDGGTSLNLNGQDELLITGWFRDSVDFDPGVNIDMRTSMGKRDIFILNMDSNGNRNWARQIGGVEEDWALSIRTDYNDNIYVSGSFDDTVDFDPGVGLNNLISNGIFGAFVLKLNSSGNFKWAGSIDGLGIENATQVCTDLNGNVYITGAFNNGTVDFDPGTSVTNLTNLGGADIFISKLDSNGNFKWVKHLGGMGNDYSTSIITDENSNIYVAGFFGFTADFDPSTTVTNNLTPLGASDIFVCKLDSVGDFKWVEQFGGTGIERCTRSNIFRSSEGEIYTIGTFEDTVDFDQTAGINNINSNGAMDIYIHKMSEVPAVPTSIKQSVTSKFKLYPNPTQGQLELFLDKQYDRVQVSILNVTGQVISSTEYRNRETVSLTLQNSPGLYFVRVKTMNGNTALFKVLKN